MRLDNYKTISLILILVLLLPACWRPSPQPTEPPQPVASGDEVALKLLVSSPGVYRVTGRDLLEAGWSQAMLDPARLSLSCAGQPVPVHAEGQAEAMSLTFYGQPPDSRYTPYRAYWLSRGDGLTPMEGGTLASTASGVVVTVTQRFEQDKLYISRAPGGGQAGSDQWFWQTVSAPRGITLTLSVETTPLASEPVRLEMALWGSTSDPVEPDHALRLVLNGQPAGEYRWDGRDKRQQASFTLPAGALLSGENKLAVFLPGDTGASADTVLINWVEVTYHCRLEDGVQAEGLPVAFESARFLAGPSLLDITDPTAPLWVAGAGEDGGGAGEDAAARLAPVVLSHTRRPEIVPAQLVPDWQTPAAGAEMLIIADPALSAAATPLIEWRAAQGLSAALLTTDQVYDQFGNGEPDPAAIRALIGQSQTSWPEPHPRYVLLLGDASYDYRGVLGKPPAAGVISPMIAVDFSGETTSDAVMADVDQDGLPDVALGRLPARNAAEAEALVARTIEYEKAAPAGDWQRQVVMIADPSEAIFARLADELAARLPPGRFDLARLYTKDPPSVVRALNDGALLVFYVGHGSLGLWGKDGLLTVEAVENLSNAGRRPVVVNFTCLTGYFAHPTAESMGEKLLRPAGGGAVAVVVPSSLTLPNDQQSFARLLVESLATPGTTLGEALLRAQRESSSSRDVRLTYALLGDPAMKLISK
ncbi:MAG: hypothetical protein JW850_19225 [Thermoflexales bacterium]|nr:hypothetical protein [Thermoflexales bacterium]